MLSEEGVPFHSIIRGRPCNFGASLSGLTRASLKNLKKVASSSKGFIDQLFIILNGIIMRMV